MRKIKIMFCIARLVIGGTEQQLLDFITDINRNRYDVIVCPLVSGGGLFKEFERANISIVVVGRKHKYDPFILWRLIRIIKRERVDILHTFLYTANFWGRIAGQLAGVPIIIAGERGIDAWKKKFHFFIDRILSSRTDLIITNAECIKDFYIHNAHINPDKFKVIRNGKKLDRFIVDVNKERKKSELKIPSDCSVVCTIGRLHPLKGCQFLLQAAKIVLEYDKNVIFLIVGDGMMRNQLESLAEQLQIGDYVRFTGFRRDIGEILSITDVFAFPTLSEGLPNVLLEAMAMRKPIVATNIDGNREIIEDNVTGILVPPKNPEKLADGVLRLLRDRKLATILGKSGYCKLEKEFAFDVMVQKIQNTYEELISKRRNRWRNDSLHAKI